MIHEVEVSNLMFNKTSEEQIDFKKYDINVELEEEQSTDQKTILKFSLDLTSNPKNSVINISGNAILEGEQEEINDVLKQDNENTPQIVLLIYQELFPLMYIISKNMKIPSPAHTIAQNNVKQSDEEASISIKEEKSDNLKEGKEAPVESESNLEEAKSQEENTDQSIENEKNTKKESQ